MKVQVEPIVPPVLNDPDAGAFVTFEGRVRRHHQGQVVDHLFYEAYEPLASAEGKKILEEACHRFGLTEAIAIHRIGRLEIGDLALWVGVCSAHRKEAFEAVDWIVDAIKDRVPIWKQEFGPELPGVWVQGSNGRSNEAASEASLFQRQVAMPEFGPEPQARLRASKVLVVGVGGLGGAALPYLAAAGIGEIAIMDHDVVEVSNLHRQPLFHWSDRGRMKARVAAANLLQQHPFVRSVAIEQKLTSENAAECIAPYDLILDGTDSFAAKFALNAACVAGGKPLVTASVHRFEGVVQLVVPGGPCLLCEWPIPPEDGCVKTCAEEGVFGPAVAMLGVWQASEAIKLLAGVGEVASDRSVWIDVLSGKVTSLSRQRRVGCVDCATSPALPAQATGFEHHDLLRERFLQWSDLARFDGLKLTIVDLREPDVHADVADIFGHQTNSIPFSAFDPKRDVDPGTPTAFVCERGVRSLAVVRKLLSMGYKDVYALPALAELIPEPSKRVQGQ